MISIITIIKDEKDSEKLYNIKKSIEEYELIVITDKDLKSTFANKVINLKRCSLNLLLKHLVCYAKYSKVLIIEDLTVIDYVNIGKLAKILDNYDVFVDINPDNFLNKVLRRMGTYILAWRGFIAINKRYIRDLIFLSSWNVNLTVLYTDQILNITSLHLNCTILWLFSMIVFPKLFIEILNMLFQYKIVRDYINEKIGVLTFKLFAFLLTISLVRILDVEGYGTYIIVLSFSFMLSSFSDLGTPLAIVRYFNEENDIKKHSQYFKIFVLMILAINSSTIFVILPLRDLIAKHFLKNEDLGYLFILSPLISLVIVKFNIFKAVFYAYRKFDIIRKIGMLEGLLKFVVVTTSSYFIGIVGAIFGFFITYLILNMILFYYINSLFPHLLEKQKTKIDMISTIKYLFSLNIVSAARSLYLWTDSLVVGYLLDPKGVGYYNATASIISTINSLINLYSVFESRIASWSIDKIDRYLPRIILINLTINLPVFLFIIVFSEHIVTILYGEEYNYVAYLVKVGAFLIILNSFACFGPIFNLKGKPEYSTISIVSGTFVNIIADFILIRMFGLVGAVIATILARVAELTAEYLLYKYKMFSKYL